MAKRYIGVDLEGVEARLAILTVSAGKIDVVFDSRTCDCPEDTVEAIREMLGHDLALGDRMVTALPCRVGLFRRLRFPFREQGKIRAALPLELGNQLPVPMAEQLISFLPPRARENDYEVDAVVVNRLEVEDMLQHFPDPEQHPRRIDYFPFALVPVLDQPEGVLIYCRRLEVVVALVYEGMILDYRLLPGTSELEAGEVLDFISTQVGQLENSVGKQDLPLWVIGAGVTEAILRELHRTGRTILAPAAEVFGPELACGMAPAALLALTELRAAKKAASLNFRRGDFAARGQLEIFRSKLVVAVLLLALVLLGGALSMHLGYLQKKRELTQMKQQMKEVFHQTMPAATPVVDVPMQLRSQLNELQRQRQLFGFSGHGAATLLQKLSAQIPVRLQLDLQELNYSNDQLRLVGQTDSFDTVNQIAEQLGQDRLFRQVEIADAKLTADNDRVNFELKIQLLAGGL